MTRMFRTLVFALLLLPFAGKAEAQLAPADAGAFMGSWTIALDTPQGNFEQSLVLKDEGGKLVGEMSSQMAPETQKVTDITKKGDDLTFDERDSAPYTRRSRPTARAWA